MGKTNSVRLSVFFGLLALLALDCFFDPVHMTSPQTFHFAAELEIAADLVVIQDAETIDDGGRFADQFDYIVRIKIHVMAVAHRQNDGIHIAQ